MKRLEQQAAREKAVEEWRSAFEPDCGTPFAALFGGIMHEGGQFKSRQAHTEPEPSTDPTEPHVDQGGADDLASLGAAMAKSKAAVAKRRRKREPSGSDTDDRSEPATKKRPAAKAAAAAKAKAKAASIAKRPAAATPLGEFDLAVGAKTHIKRGAAADEPRRQNFVSKLHHRVKAQSLKAGVSEVRSKQIMK